MVEIIPEIETFFQQEQFSQEQLDALKGAIEDKYKDKHSRRLARSAINAKLLQYQLSGPIEARDKEKEIEVNKNPIKKTKAPKTKQSKNAKKKNSKKVEVLNKQNRSQLPPKDRIKAKKIIKRSNNSRKSTPGVYGKLIKAKTIGSIIYTRMK